jgi:hypothetical protein
VIGYALLLLPVLSDDPAPLVVDVIFPDSILLQALVSSLSAGGAVAASMYIVRALWNRLFPHLCGWKEINLAESSAISLFFGLFSIQ